MRPRNLPIRSANASQEMQHRWIAVLFVRRENPLQSGCVHELPRQMTALRSNNLHHSRTGPATPTILFEAGAASQRHSSLLRVRSDNAPADPVANSAASLTQTIEYVA